VFNWKCLLSLATALAFLFGTTGISEAGDLGGGKAGAAAKAGKGAKKGKKKGAKKGKGKKGKGKKGAAPS
jgi:hypothetical protein